MHHFNHMEYYYVKPEQIYSKESLIKIDGYVVRHLINVLRKKVGDSVILTDGLRNIFYSKIVEINRNSVVCSYDRTDYNLYEPVMYLRLFAAPLRNSARFEFLVEKSVELGVSEIIPVFTSNTVKKGKLSDSYHFRLDRIVTSAIEQSQRCFKPIVHKSISFGEMLSVFPETSNKLFFYEFADVSNKAELNFDDKNVNIFVGPEGGISADEVRILKENNWKPCSLGPRKLRAETASIAGILEILNIRKD